MPAADSDARNRSTSAQEPSPTAPSQSQEPDDAYDVLVKLLDQQIRNKFGKVPQTAGELVAHDWASMIDAEMTTIRRTFDRFLDPLEKMIGVIQNFERLMELTFLLGRIRGEKWAVIPVRDTTERMLSAAEVPGARPQTGAARTTEEGVWTEEEVFGAKHVWTKSFAEHVAGAGEASCLSRHFSGENHHRRGKLPAALRSWFEGPEGGALDENADCEQTR